MEECQKDQAMHQDEFQENTLRSYVLRSREAEGAVVEFSMALSLRCPLVDHQVVSKRHLAPTKTSVLQLFCLGFKGVVQCGLPLKGTSSG